jgi:DNA-binding beta-propeller fold protein YncE
LLSLQRISSIATFTYNNRDLIYTQNLTEEVFKVQWAIYDYEEGIYLPKFTPESNVDLLRNGLFASPEDVTVDNSGNIYVVDSFKDSLYKFSSLGKLKSESFGGTGSSITQFSRPSGVVFFDKTLYICDTGNNRILRFILSTDIN